MNPVVKNESQSTIYMGEGISAAKCNRIKIGGISVVEVCFAEGVTKIDI